MFVWELFFKVSFTTFTFNPNISFTNFFYYFLLKDFCDGGTLHEKIVSAKKVSKSNNVKNSYNSSAKQKSWLYLFGLDLPQAAAIWREFKLTTETTVIHLLATITCLSILAVV